MSRPSGLTRPPPDTGILPMRICCSPGATRQTTIGVFSEETDRPATEDAVRQWGFPVAGRLAVPHPDDARLVRRVFWLDAAP